MFHDAYYCCCQGTGKKCSMMHIIVVARALVRNVPWCILLLLPGYGMKCSMMHIIVAARTLVRNVPWCILLLLPGHWLEMFYDAYYCCQDTGKKCSMMPWLTGHTELTRSIRRVELELTCVLLVPQTVHVYSLFLLKLTKCAQIIIIYLGTSHQSSVHI